MFISSYETHNCKAHCCVESCTNINLAGSYCLQSWICSTQFDGPFSFPFSQLEVYSCKKTVPVSFSERVLDQVAAKLQRRLTDCSNITIRLQKKKTINLVLTDKWQLAVIRDEMDTTCYMFQSVHTV